MADIQEIPLESEAPVEKGEGKNQNDEEIAEDIAPAQEDIPPKRGRGRPWLAKCLDCCLPSVTSALWPGEIITRAGSKTCEAINAGYCVRLGC